MTDNKWRNRKIRSFRVSEALESMIKQECERRNTDFSSFMRYAAVAVMPNCNQTVA
jgi:hypothetical protein